MDMSHLHALEVGLSHERARLANAKTDGERELRAVWVRQLERQVEDENKRLGLDVDPYREMTVDEIAAELGL